PRRQLRRQLGRAAKVRQHLRQAVRRSLADGVDELKRAAGASELARALHPSTGTGPVLRERLGEGGRTQGPLDEELGEVSATTVSLGYARSCGAGKSRSAGNSTSCAGGVTASPNPTSI